MSTRRAPVHPAPAFSPREVEGEPDALGLRVAVVCSRWNPSVTDAMLSSCLAALERRGARSRDVIVVRVPGSFELVGAASALVARGGWDAVVALGAVIRGKTSHHEVLGHAVATALASLSASSGVPIGFGLLTCETVEQAHERREKGAEAAEAAVEMASLRRILRRGKGERRKAKGGRVTEKLHESALRTRRSHDRSNG